MRLGSPVTQKLWGPWVIFDWLRTTMPGTLYDPFSAREILVTYVLPDRGRSRNSVGLQAKVAPYPLKPFVLLVPSAALYGGKPLY